MIDVREADRILATHELRGRVCLRPLAEAAGHVLRQEVRVDRDQPPYDRVTMDGVAVRSESVAGGRRRLRRQGVQPAGRPPLTLDAPDACIEVTTGAVLPHGCDAVVRIEDVEVDGETVTLRDDLAVAPLQNVHPRASDAARGAVAIPAGVRLSPAHVGIAAAMGVADLRVSVPPALAVVSTGDELVDVAVRPERHQVRRSNGFALQAALGLHGHGQATLRHLADDAPALRSGLAAVLDWCEVLVVTGGVSVGRTDLVPRVLSDLGVTNHLHRVRQRPGKPFWFGTRDGLAVFALPGNPVSALTCLVRYVLPFLERSAGATRRVPRVRLAEGVRGLAGMTRFVPVALGDDGLATPVPTNTSGDFLALGRSDGFVEVAEGAGGASAGTDLAFHSWSPG